MLKWLKTPSNIKDKHCSIKQYNFRLASFPGIHLQWLPVCLFLHGMRSLSNGSGNETTWYVRIEPVNEDNHAYSHCSKQPARLGQGREDAYIPNLYRVLYAFNKLYACLHVWLSRSAVRSFSINRHRPSIYLGPKVEFDAPI